MFSFYLLLHSITVLRIFIFIEKVRRKELSRLFNLNSSSFNRFQMCLCQKTAVYFISFANHNIGSSINRILDHIEPLSLSSDVCHSRFVFLFCSQLNCSYSNSILFDCVIFVVILLFLILLFLKTRQSMTSSNFNLNQQVKCIRF